MQPHCLPAFRSFTPRGKAKRAALLLAAAAAMHAAPSAAATACADLTSFLLPDTTITLAQSYTAGATVSGSTKAPVDLCRVAGTIKPGPQSNIHFEVWIPTEANWNGKYQQTVIDADHDLVKTLESWVGQGIAPQRIIATHYVNNVASQGVAFQRPLCPYPERAEYVGSGDPNDASNFRCVAHHDPYDPRNIGPQKAYK